MLSTLEFCYRAARLIFDLCYLLVIFSLFTRLRDAHPPVVCLAAAPLSAISNNDARK